MDHSHQHSAAAATPNSGGASDSGYTCPMHPEIRSQQPDNCPKCGMVLVPVA